jgi:hypothetical protein
VLELRESGNSTEEVQPDEAACLCSGTFSGSPTSCFESPIFEVEIEIDRQRTTSRHRNFTPTLNEVGACETCTACDVRVEAASLAFRRANYHVAFPLMFYVIRRLWSTGQGRSANVFAVFGDGYSHREAAPGPMSLLRKRRSKVYQFKSRFLQVGDIPR